VKDGLAPSQATAMTLQAYLRAIDYRGFVDGPPPALIFYAPSTARTSSKSLSKTSISTWTRNRL